MLQRIRETPGFALSLKLDERDLQTVRGGIADHLAAQIERIAPSQLSLFRSTPLEQYHTIAGILPHNQLLTRTARILPQDAVDQIRRTSLFRQLESEFGHFDISDEEGIGRESISLRLVRPGVETDVGSLHADDWFWKLYNFALPKGKQRVKVWAAICCEPGKSGLLLSPDSHVRNWKYRLYERAGMVKPLLEPDEKPPLRLIESNPGDAVAFNYHLLHGGAVTRGELTRVSIEFTVLIPDEVYLAPSPLPARAIH
jgi:hypothetical protein